VITVDDIMSRRLSRLGRPMPSNEESVSLSSGQELLQVIVDVSDFEMHPKPILLRTPSHDSVPPRMPGRPGRVSGGLVRTILLVLIDIDPVEAGRPHGVEVLSPVTTC